MVKYIDRFYSCRIISFYHAKCEYQNKQSELQDINSGFKKSESVSWDKKLQLPCTFFFKASLVWHRDSVAQVSQHEIDINPLMLI